MPPQAPPEAFEIKLLRERLGWSQVRLAHQLGVDPTYIVHLESSDLSKVWTMRPRLTIRYRAFEKQVYQAMSWAAEQRLVVCSRFKLPRELIVLTRPRKCRGHRRYCLFKTPRQKYCGDECKRLWEERHKRRKGK